MTFFGFLLTSIMRFNIFSSLKTTAFLLCIGLFGPAMGGLNGMICSAKKITGMHFELNCISDNDKTDAKVLSLSIDSSSSDILPLNKNETAIIQNDVEGSKTDSSSEEEEKKPKEEDIPKVDDSKKDQAEQNDQEPPTPVPALEWDGNSENPRSSLLKKAAEYIINTPSRVLGGIRSFAAKQIAVITTEAISDVVENHKLIVDHVSDKIEGIADQASTTAQKAANFTPAPGGLADRVIRIAEKTTDSFQRFSNQEGFDPETVNRVLSIAEKGLDLLEKTDPSKLSNEVKEIVKTTIDHTSEKISNSISSIPSNFFRNISDYLFGSIDHFFQSWESLFGDLVKKVEFIISINFK